MEPQPSQLPFAVPAPFSVLIVCDRAHIAQRTATMASSLHTVNTLVRLLPVQQGLQTDSTHHLARAAAAPIWVGALRPTGAAVGTWRQIRDVWHALRTYRPSIIHCSSIKTSYVAACARWLLAFSHPWLFSPAIITELDRFAESTGVRRTTRMLRFVSDTFMVESNADRDVLMRHRIKSMRVHVSPLLYPEETTRDASVGLTWAEQMRTLYLAAYIERRHSEAPYLGLVG
jgi:hypothetical protein